MAAQNADIVDAFHRRGRLISSKLLIAENGKSLFEGELEPIAAGDAIAGPIVEIFVRDDRFDLFVIHVSGGVGPCQDILGIEHVEAFIFHRAHVEIIYGHNHVDIKIVGAAVCFFVPLHRGDQALQGMFALIGVLVFDQNFATHLAAVHGGKIAGVAVQITGYQSE